MSTELLAVIRTPHHSVRAKGRRMPRDMHRIVCADPDTIHMVRKMAMEVFADMTAHDYPFTDAITAVFVTGMKLAQDIQEPR